MHCVLCKAWKDYDNCLKSYPALSVSDTEPCMKDRVDAFERSVTYNMVCRDLMLTFINSLEQSTLRRIVRAKLAVLKDTKPPLGLDDVPVPLKDKVTAASRWRRT